MKTQRKYTSVILLCCLALFAISCGSKDKNNDTITPTPASVTLAGEGGAQDVAINASTDWGIAGNSGGGWLTATKSNGATLHIAAGKNDSGNDRTATITLTAGNASVAVNVTQQKYSASINVNPASITIPAIGGEQVITVTAPADWTANPDAAWIVSTKQSATQLKISAGPNETGADRSGKVTLTSGTLTAVVAVSQAKLTIQSDSLALVALYNATAGASWSTKWNLSTPLKSWKGVSVEGGRVVKLDLPNNNLAGAFAASINGLTELTYLDLSENKLSGAIPTLDKLTKLQVIDVHSNQLTGSLPTSLSHSNALLYLDFCQNQLQGALPSDWKSLAQLQVLDLGLNGKLSGTIPGTWSVLKKMEILWLHGNQLGQGIPAYIADFSALEDLALEDNNFTGSIPSGLGDLPNLTELSLSNNKLDGALPNSLLNNSFWQKWQPNVCPQQTGFGFTNGCESSPAPQMQSGRSKAHATLLKAKYKQLYK